MGEEKLTESKRSGYFYLCWAGKNSGSTFTVSRVKIRINALTRILVRVIIKNIRRRLK